MKTLMMILALSSAVPAMALELSEGGGGSEPAMTYISWCESNAVVAQDSKGELYVRANCSEQGQKCRSLQIYESTGITVKAHCY